MANVPLNYLLLSNSLGVADNEQVKESSIDQTGNLQGRETKKVQVNLSEFVTIALEVNDNNDKTQDEMVEDLQKRNIRNLLVGGSGVSAVMGAICMIASSVFNNDPALAVGVVLEGLALVNYFGTYYFYPCTKLPAHLINEVVLD